MRRAASYCSLLPIILAIFVSGSTTSSLPQEPCRGVKFRGSVKSGQSFRKPVGRGLIFLVEARGDVASGRGWTIKMLSEGKPDKDYIRVVTPPYGSTADWRLASAYQISPEQEEFSSPRRFLFVEDEEEYEKARLAVGKLLQSDVAKEQKMAEARQQLALLRTGSGELHILELREVLVISGEPGVSSRYLDDLEFEVRLCFSDLRRTATPTMHQPIPADCIPLP